MIIRYLIVILLLACSACSSFEERSQLKPEADRYRSDTHTALAIDALELGQADTASRQADRAIIASSNSNALHARALAALALDDTATARIYFQKALDAQGGYSDAVLLLNYGTFLCNEGQAPEGLDMLQKAAKAAPSEARRVKRLSATCTRSPEKDKSDLNQHKTLELNGFWDE